MKGILIIQSFLLLSLHLFAQNGLISPDGKDLIIQNSGDSVMCKIINEDSLNVYILLQKNDIEIKSYVAKKNVRAIEKNFYTSEEYNIMPNNDNMEFIHFGNGLRVVSNISLGCAIGSGLLYLANENEKFFNAFVIFSVMYPASSFTGSLFSCIGTSIKDPSGSNYYWKKFGTTILPIAILGYGVPLLVISSKTENIGLLVSTWIVGGVAEFVFPMISNDFIKEIHWDYADINNVKISLNPTIDYNNNLMVQLTVRWTIQ